MKKSKLQKWAHVAEISGAIAVVVSLIYVGYEVRENTRAQHSRTHLELYTWGYEWDGWYRDREFAELVAKASDDYGSLSTGEKLQFDKHVLIGLNLWEYAFASRQLGQLQADSFAAWDAFFSTEIRNPAWRSVWNANRNSYHGEFPTHVDSIIEAH